MNVIYLVLYITCFVLSSFAHQSSNSTINSTLSLENSYPHNRKQYGLRGAQSHHSSYQRSYYSHMSLAEFQQLFQEALSDSIFTIRNTNAYGDVLAVRLSDGMGARWTATGEVFIGFLERYTTK